jgi:hypothetical protein
MDHTFGFPCEIIPATMPWWKHFEADGGIGIVDWKSFGQTCDV